MALPKQRTAKSRRDRRRSHDALKAKSLVQCSNCGEKRLPITFAPTAGIIKAAKLSLLKNKLSNGP